MNSKQLIAIVLVGLLIGSLFFKGYKSAKGNVQTGSASSLGFDFNEYLNEELAKLLPEQQTKLKAIGSDTTDLNQLQQKIVLWDSLNNQLIAAHYMEIYARIDDSEKSWMTVGSKYYTFAGLSNDSLMISYAGLKAKHAFEKVIKLNSENLDAQTALAAIVIQLDEDVMKGVGLLKDVVAKDSNHVQAIFTLGMLSIQSNQYDKALSRFEKLVQLQPFNAEYYFYLGEVQAKMGNTKDAVKTYETCKTLLKDEQAQKEIQSLINKLKNI
ncbi:MAG: tetratricopeptide repeat protein [Bacteroidia bacterium]|jgi:tetratricopeptide (TPR) repeat protein|nr:tetratricopeptide repeat protein [Bacteroidia bacterium]